MHQRKEDQHRATAPLHHQIHQLQKSVIQEDTDSSPSKPQREETHQASSKTPHQQLPNNPDSILQREQKGHSPSSAVQFSNTANP
ncbi:hypothetical protein Nepgr_033841 [Nepenthes gracilis]|uniref:Uncharacterized protein n=1 Tax=Nepenthes gracilis TaxID=150966 RepID=A0AAD3TN32_NEPGR|nr:hypothetical protein Nepgr_033841 [Nepenthes gracilis]